MANTGMMLLSGIFVALFPACHNHSRGHEVSSVLHHNSSTVAFVNTTLTSERHNRCQLVHTVGSPDVKPAVSALDFIVGAHCLAVDAP